MNNELLVVHEFNQIAAEWTRAGSGCGDYLLTVCPWGEGKFRAAIKPADSEESYVHADALTAEMAVASLMLVLLGIARAGPRRGADPTIPDARQFQLTERWDKSAWEDSRWNQ